MQICGLAKNQIFQHAEGKWSLLNARHQAVEFVILDEAAVFFLKPTGVATFADYVNDVFKIYIERQRKDSMRINIM